MDKRVTFVGVDIGVHSIKIAFSRENSKRAEIFEDKVNERMIKNVFSLGGSRKIGNLATGELKSNLSQTVFGVNDFMTDLHQTTGFKESLYHNFTKVYFDKGKAVFQMLYKNKQIDMTVEEILAGIFSEIRIQLEQMFTNIQLVVVVPDNYLDTQKAQIIKSMMIAGFDNVSIEQNSRALAIQYLLTKREEINPQYKKHVVFVDIGYASTKISFLSIEGRSVQVQYFDQKQNLGVRNLDNKIVQYVVVDVWKKTGVNIEGKKKIMQRVFEEVRKKRKELSSNKSCNIELLDLLENKHYSFKLQRVWFDQVNRESMQALENFIVSSICQAQKNKFDINTPYEVQMIGGGSRIPMFQDIIMDLFQRAPQKNFDAVESLSLGTAIAKNVQVYVSQQIPYNYFLRTSDPWTKQNNKEILFESGTQYQCYKKMNVDPNQNLLFECILQGPHFQQKVISFRVDAKEEISIDFEIDDNGFIQLGDDSKEYVYDYWDTQQIENLKELRNTESKILDDHLNDELLENLRYDLEKKLYELKSFKRPQISENDESEINKLEEEIKGCMDQNGNQDFKEIQDNLHQYMEQVDYMMSRISGRQHKVDKLKEFIQEYDQQTNKYLTEFDSRYGEQLLKLSEQQSFSIMRKKLQGLAIHKKLRKLSVEWNENSTLLDEMDIENEMRQLQEIVEFLKDVVNDLSHDKKIRDSVFGQ